MSDSESDLIDLTGSPLPKTSKAAQPAPDHRDIRMAAGSTWKPAVSKVLAGQTFHFVGVWATMSAENAKEICRANGGTVVTASKLPSYVVIGAKSAHTTLEVAQKLGGEVLTEAAYLSMILGDKKENLNSKKRAADADAAGPSKPRKAPRKSEPTPATDADLKRVGDFLYGGRYGYRRKLLLRLTAEDKFSRPSVVRAR
ncbi:hypothetical protein HGRIS_007704 [Hohenbuehelia grisea]|uniref:BRCT domain-containing protein n=1 Tax=Hohenbuehelia grisea TaxID=104357 RepID=A0ABR3J5T8_9AGAR